MEIDDILHGSWPPTDEAVRALLDEACVDAYDEYEQATGMHCVIEDQGRLPCPAVVKGQRGTLVEVDLREASLVGLVRFAQRGPVPVPLEDVVPEPGSPAAFLVAMYRLWRGARPLVVEIEQPASDAPPGWSTARARLAALDASAVTELVGKLYAASVGNQRLIHEALGLPPPGTDLELVGAYRRKIARCVAPGPDDPMMPEHALELIDAYRAETGDVAGQIELCVVALEAGRDAIDAYGSLYEAYYDEMVDIAVRCTDLLHDAEEEVASRFVQRLWAVQSAVKTADYGYGDRLYDVFAELDGFWEE